MLKLSQQFNGLLAKLKSVFEWFTRRSWAILILIVLLAYWRLPLTYFEQDEWQAFETYISNQGQSTANTCLGVQRPLTCVVNKVEWHLFGVNAYPYGLTSLILVSVIVLLLYQFYTNWPIPRHKAIMAAGLFPLFVVGSQAITWFGAFSASLSSFLFAVLALNFFVADLKEPTFRWRILTVASIMTSLYFKEESLWIFPALIAIWIFYPGKLKMNRNWLGLFKQITPLIAMGILFLVGEWLRQAHGTSFSGLISTTEPGHYGRDVLTSLVFLPVSHLAHIILPPEVLIDLSVGTGFSISVLSWFIFGLMLLTFILFVILRPAKERPLFLTLIIWALTAFVAYAIFGKNPEFLEGRYYFSAQAAVVALLVVGLLPNRIPIISSFNTLGTGLFLIIFGINFVVLQQRLTYNVAVGRERQNIISYIRKHTGPLPSKAIILTETTNYGYAGQAEFLLPFQNGLGTTLRVIYQNYNQDYRKFATKQLYLWNLVNQGYDEIDGIGFGYFREYHLVEETLKKYNLPIESVFAFRYQGKGIDDITSLVRGRLDLRDKKLVPINRGDWKVSTSNDSGIDIRHGVEKILDADPKSDWSTPHKYGEYVKVDFGKVIDRVGEIQLRTADGNSYPRIYHFSYTLDGKNWFDDFTDGGSITPDNVTSIRFGSKSIRAFQITIYDSRPIFFDWSVSDIKAFTAEQ